MKKLVCEICGSNDLLKQDDHYVCESCGTKFTAEEAKKLLVDVDVSVTIDNSAQTKKLYEVARRAFKNGDYQTAETNYKAILNDIPDDWEAYFLSVYCDAMQCTIGGIASAADQIKYCLEDTIALISGLDSDEKKKDAVLSVASWCSVAAQNLITSDFNHFSKFMNVEGNRHEFEKKTASVGNMLLICTGEINKKFPYSTKPSINKQLVITAKKALDLERIYSSFGVLTQQGKDMLVQMIEPHDAKFAEDYRKKQKNGEIFALVVYILFLVGGAALAYSGKNNLMSFSFMFGAFLAVVGFFAAISSIVKLAKGKKK